MSSILDIVPIPVYTREAFPSDKLKEFAQGAGSAVWRAAFDPNTLFHVLGGAAKWGLGGGAAGLFHRDGVGSINIRRKYLGLGPVVGAMASPTGVRWHPHRRTRVAREERERIPAL